MCVCVWRGERGRQGGKQFTSHTPHILFLNEPDKERYSYTMKGERSISLIGTGPVGGRGAKDEEPSLNTDTAVEWSAEKR